MSAYDKLKVDNNYPTWTLLTWWEKLIGREPQHMVFMLPDGTLVCSAETKEYYETTKLTEIPYWLPE